MSYRTQRSRILCQFPFNVWQLVSGSDGKTIKIWGLESGECVETLNGHDGGIRSLTIISNGILLSSDDHGNIKFWR
jgi:WD40 repeat protein